MIKPTVIAIPIFALLIGLEAWFTLRRELGEYPSKDTWINILIGFVSVVFDALFGLGFILVYTLVYEYAPYHFPVDAWWSWAILFVADDFSYYWFHRVSHESRLFWNFHVVHHSSSQYNLSVAVRQSWFSGSLHWLFYVPVMFMGFPPWMFATMHGFNLLYQFWIHTKLVRGLGPLEWVLNSPAHHRVHHGVNDQYLDRNYGGVLITWDRLFGTYEPEGETPRYGIIKPLESFNPLWINSHAWVEMWEAMKRSPGFRGKLRCIFASPNLDEHILSNE
jgi:sterol desaturase/sphingolipid hydroxylase (fatty acid hydroxylase superfamily)